VQRLAVDAQTGDDHLFTERVASISVIYVAFESGGDGPIVQALTSRHHRSVFVTTVSNIRPVAISIATVQGRGLHDAPQIDRWAVVDQKATSGLPRLDVAVDDLHRPPADSLVAALLGADEYGAVALPGGGGERPSALLDEFRRPAEGKASGTLPRPRPRRRHKFVASIADANERRGGGGILCLCCRFCWWS